jgi:uncharacterized protein YjbI with pentapeptide repeats
MATPKHLKVLKQGTATWNKWREKNPEIRPDLSGADLTGVTLSKANLVGTDFSRAILTWADLDGADLTGANLKRTTIGFTNLNWAILREANLQGADLFASVFWGTDFSNANLRNTNLRFAVFSGVTLVGTDFYKASLGPTVFADVDLSASKGLETVKHYGPSTIGADTIYWSDKRIPKAFLRGAGVPNQLITNAFAHGKPSVLF